MLAADLSADEPPAEFVAEGEGSSSAGPQDPTTPEEAIALGYDVDGDGTIAPIDVLLIANAVSDQEAGAEVTDEVLAAYDLNGDGVLSDADATLVIDYLNSVELDLDGVDAAIEDAAPNNGDGNNDGIPDSEQDEVASFQDVASEAIITLDGGAYPLVDVQSIEVSADLSPVDTEFGLIAFEVHDVEPGSVVEVNVTLPEGVSVRRTASCQHG